MTPCLGQGHVARSKSSPVDTASRHEPAQVEAALDQTLSDLGLKYLDLYLMHWPVSNIDGNNSIYFIPVCHFVLMAAQDLTIPETWHAMTALLKTGKVRHVGISNFSPAQLSALLTNSTTRPSAHQMELHPYLPQTAWLLYHAAHNIHVTAYSPLGNANPTYGPPQKDDPPLLLDNDVIRSIAKTRACTPATVALAWGLGRGTSVIPKSRHLERIRENFKAPGCVLEYSDWKALEGIGEKSTRFNNPGKSWGVKLYDGLDGVHRQRIYR